MASGLGENAEEFWGWVYGKEKTAHLQTSVRERKIKFALRMGEGDCLFYY